MNVMRVNCIHHLVLIAAAFLLAGCSGRPQPSEVTSPTPPTPPGSRSEMIDRALASATRYLLEKQSDDGAWRSDTYATFKDGTSLTPLAMEALHVLDPTTRTLPAADRGTVFLASLVQSDGKIDYGSGPNYPIYSATLAVSVLSRPALAGQRNSKVRDALLADLRRRQLTEELGWQPADPEYGGWGYCPLVPEKLKPGEFGPPFIESNISATVFALEALKAAGVPPDDPVWKKALVFVERCQNYADPADPMFDDGGFFFIYEDPTRNKAGLAGKDAAGRIRFYSYGGPTADGVRALLLCGLTADHPRVKAARRWLEAHFDAQKPPGTFAKEREIDRQGTYFYYCASVGRAFRVLGVQEVETASGKVKWAEALADELMKRQQPDGSWSNPFHAYREDDPLAATCLAVMALANCRGEKQ
jgi:squalene-hopene/tetraprenyl-beta-curcumene cyclase